MNIYKCDSCGKTIEDKYNAKMTEFYVDDTGTIDGDICCINKQKIDVIHLCEKCYKNLKDLGTKIRFSKKRSDNDKKIVQTGEILIRKKRKYEVVIADDNIFVVCPIKYNKKEKSEIVKYTKAEIYANQNSINTLKDLKFEQL